MTMANSHLAEVGKAGLKLLNSREDGTMAV